MEPPHSKFVSSWSLFAKLSCACLPLLPLPSPSCMTVGMESSQVTRRLCMILCVQLNISLR